MLLVKPEHYGPDRMPDQQRFADQMIAVFRQIGGEYDKPAVGARLIRLLRNLCRGRHYR